MFQQTHKTTSKTDRKHVGFRRSSKKEGGRTCMKTKKKEEKNEDLTNIQKCTHGTVLHVSPIQ